MLPNLHLLLAVLLLRPLPLDDEGVEGDRRRVVERQRDGIVLVPGGKIVQDYQIKKLFMIWVSLVIQVGPGPVDDGHEVVADGLDARGGQVPHGLLPVGDVPVIDKP